jgi:hypothetical protein
MPDIVGNYARALQLRQMQQNAPLQNQILQQQAQQGQMQNQQEQQAMQDQQAFRSAMSDPSMQGKTLGQIADSLAQKGSLSTQTYQALKKADIDQRTAYASLDEKQLANAQATHNQTQQLYDNVMRMDDNTIAQNWQSIAQQYDAIPGNQKQALNPNQPMTKAQLQQFGPFISMNSAYLDNETQRRTQQADARQKEAKAALDELNTQRGGTTDLDKFVYDYLQTNNLDNTPANRQKAFDVYTQKTKIDPAQVRVEGYAQTREYPVFDNQTKTTVMLNAADLNAANSQQPGRYTVAGFTPEALGQKTTTEYFTTGKGAQQVTAFKTAINHLDLLDKLSADLGNGNTQIFNRASQAWAEQTGNPAPANFAAAKNAMSGEVAAALKASGATDQEIAKVGDTFSRAQSPAQLQGAINTYRTLLQSKAQNLQQQYQQGMQGKPNFGSQQSGGVLMRAPNGQTKFVSADQVDHYTRMGAKVVQ